MTPTETERDLDDYSEEFDANSHDDFETNRVYDDDRVLSIKDNDLDSKLLDDEFETKLEENDKEIVGKENESNAIKTQEEILNEILDETEASSSDLKPKSLDSKSDGFSDPLRDFTDVDLS